MLGYISPVHCPFMRPHLHLYFCFFTRGPTYKCQFTRSSRLLTVKSIGGDFCSTVYSDNAKTFKYAYCEIRKRYKSQLSDSNQPWNDINQDELEARLVSKGIKWKLTLERLPKRGGWREGFLGNVKKPLRKVLGKA